MRCGHVTCGAPSMALSSSGELPRCNRQQPGRPRPTSYQRKTPLRHTSSHILQQSRAVLSTSECKRMQEHTDFKGEAYVAPACTSKLAKRAEGYCTFLDRQNRHAAALTDPLSGLLPLKNSWSMTPGPVARYGCYNLPTLIEADGLHARGLYGPIQVWPNRQAAGVPPVSLTKR